MYFLNKSNKLFFGMCEKSSISVGQFDVTSKRTLQIENDLQ